jgi:aminoglycoside phosphotransferase (APT) family kinase protein
LTGIDWRIAFNLFRLAAIYQGIAARSSAGNAVRSDAASYGSRVAPLAELAVGLLDAAC